MAVLRVTDPSTSLERILEAADADGVLLESESRKRYAVLPLDDDLVDYLLEHNPRFIEDCARIRDRMRGGKFHGHDEVKKALSEDRPE